jgi:hypothetical protein
MGKAGKKRKRQRLARLASVPPMVPCSRTANGIHRDGWKCDACQHHHCRACGICARCRRYGDQRCLRVNELAVPLATADRPKGAPWWKNVRKWKADQQPARQGAGS